MNNIVFQAVALGGSKTLRFPNQPKDILIKVPDKSGKLLTTNSTIAPGSSPTFTLGLVQVEDLQVNTTFPQTAGISHNDLIEKPAAPLFNRTDGNFKVASGFTGTHTGTIWRLLDPTAKKVLMVLNDPDCKHKFPVVSAKVVAGAKLQYRYVSGTTMSPWSNVGNYVPYDTYTSPEPPVIFRLDFAFKRVSGNKITSVDPKLLTTQLDQLGDDIDLNWTIKTRTEGTVEEQTGITNKLLKSDYTKKTEGVYVSSRTGDQFSFEYNNVTDYFIVLKAKSNGHVYIDFYTFDIAGDGDVVDVNRPLLGVENIANNTGSLKLKLIVRTDHHVKTQWTLYGSVGKTQPLQKLKELVSSRYLTSIPLDILTDVVLAPYRLISIIAKSIHNDGTADGETTISNASNDISFSTIPGTGRFIQEQAQSGLITDGDLGGDGASYTDPFLGQDTKPSYIYVSDYDYASRITGYPTGKTLAVRLSSDMAINKDLLVDEKVVIRINVNDRSDKYTYDATELETILEIAKENNKLDASPWVLELPIGKFVKTTLDAMALGNLKQAPRVDVSVAVIVKDTSKSFTTADKRYLISHSSFELSDLNLEVEGLTVNSNSSLAVTNVKNDLPNVITVRKLIGTLTQVSNNEVTKVEINLTSKIGLLDSDVKDKITANEDFLVSCYLETNAGNIPYKGDSLLINDTTLIAAGSLPGKVTLGTITSNLPDTIKFKINTEFTPDILCKGITVNLKRGNTVVASKFLVTPGDVTFEAKKLPYDNEGVNSLTVEIITDVYNKNYGMGYSVTTKGTIDRQIKDTFVPALQDKIRDFKTLVKNTTVAMVETSPYFLDTTGLLMDTDGNLHSYVKVVEKEYRLPIPKEYEGRVNGEAVLKAVEFYVYDNWITTGFFILRSRP